MNDIIDIDCARINWLDDAGRSLLVTPIAEEDSASALHLAHDDYDAFVMHVDYLPANIPA